MGHAQPANVPVDTLLEQSVTVPNIFEKELFVSITKRQRGPGLTTIPLGPKERSTLGLGSFLIL